jgi:hypothetical protein
MPIFSDENDGLSNQERILSTQKKFKKKLKILVGFKVGPISSTSTPLVLSARGPWQQSGACVGECNPLKWMSIDSGVLPNLHNASASLRAPAREPASS